MTCRKQVSQGVLSFGCADDEGHGGPCWAREVVRSVLNRKEWEAAQKRAKESGAPLTLAELGMQGEPQTFNIDPRQKEGRRLHPDEERRLREVGEEADSLENQIVNTAGGVDISNVIQRDPRYDAYEKRERATPGNEWKEWEEKPVVEDTGPSGFQAVLDHEAARTPEVVNNVFIQEPTKQRPGDQPLPVHTGGEAIQDLVIQDIEDRKRIGLERYGTLLQAHNGRDSLLDAYEEAIDLSLYLKQALVEREIEEGHRGPSF